MLDLSIVIPFKNKAKMTIDCLNSLQSFGGHVKQIVLVSNNSSPIELERILDASRTVDTHLELLEYNHPYNFQAEINAGARRATGKVIMMLNNDTKFVAHSRQVLSAMYEKALRPEVGAVGCVLLYGDGKTIQHAGAYLVPGGTADHLYTGHKLGAVLRGAPSKTYPYNIRKDLRVSAVTAAALTIEKAKFDRIAGMDEGFAICGGDVDLCLRLHERGYENWLIGCDDGYIIHEEGRSRSAVDVPYGDFVRSYESYIRHFDINTGDPFVQWSRGGHG